ncbi:hypothetical protein TURU_148717 [Turdus rufiventris]|nr:hypothetical protein TURU_148717 [Turdus rufiventris]
MCTEQSSQLSSRRVKSWINSFAPRDLGQLCQDLGQHCGTSDSASRTLDSAARTQDSAARTQDSAAGTWDTSSFLSEGQNRGLVVDLLLLKQGYGPDKDAVDGANLYGTGQDSATTEGTRGRLGFAG